jgi:molecular chaperone GrpE
MTDTPEDKATAEADIPAAPLPEARIAALEAEAAQMKDRALRAMADAENTRKRAQKDMEETTKYAVSGFAQGLVGVAENLYRALASVSDDARKSDAVKSLADGVEMTLKELLGVFERHGIRRIDPVGEKFDPHYHQAMLQVDVPDSEAGTVVQVLQAGYAIHDRLLRPALVGVARQPAQGEDPKRVDATA